MIRLIVAKAWKYAMRVLGWIAHAVLAHAIRDASLNRVPRPTYCRSIWTCAGIRHDTLRSVTTFTHAMPAPRGACKEIRFRQNILTS